MKPTRHLLTFMTLGLFILPVATACGEDSSSQSTAPAQTEASAEAEAIVETPAADEAVACTMEVMMCPDGSSVGRTGPNCEFAPCPDAGESTTMEEAPAEDVTTEEAPAEETHSEGMEDVPAAE